MRKTREQRREDLGLSATELADRLGVATSTIRRWEKGEMGIHPLRDRDWESLLAMLEKRSKGRAAFLRRPLTLEDTRP